MEIDLEDLLISLIKFEKEDAGFESPGRTIIQKKVYFLNELLNLNVKFKPHYYGPYSEEVAQTLSNLIGLDFVNETRHSFSIRNIWGEGRKYSYELTDDGKIIFEEFKKKNPEKLQQIKNALEKINGTKGISDNYRTISLAAKIHHIVKMKGPITASEVEKESGKFAWEVKVRENIIEFLEQLQLITRKKAKA